MFGFRCRLPVAVLGLLLLTACGLAARPRQELTTAFQDYTQRLRWKDYAGAAAYLPEEHRESFRQRFDALADLNIVDVRIDSVDFREAENRATTVTVVEYYMLPSLVVKKSRLSQEWVYEGADRYHVGTWHLTGAFPPFP